MLAFLFTLTLNSKWLSHHFHCGFKIQLACWALISWMIFRWHFRLFVLHARIYKQDFRFTYECPFTVRIPMQFLLNEHKMQKGLLTRLQLNCLLIYLIKVLLIYSWISDCTLSECIQISEKFWCEIFHSHVKFIVHNILLEKMDYSLEDDDVRQFRMMNGECVLLTKTHVKRSFNDFQNVIKIFKLKWIDFKKRDGFQGIFKILRDGT